MPQSLSPSPNSVSALWERILVPTDFSPPADAALSYAVKLAQACGATLHVLHVVPIPHVLDSLYERGLEQPESLKRIWQNARRRIKAATSAAMNGETVTMRVHFSEGEAVTEVLERATKLKPDLIVMGTHGRQGTKRFLMGSVAEGVVRRAPCPVMTVRSSNTAG
jgi:nucleotide-binding universal stress UspA family protein